MQKLFELKENLLISDYRFPYDIAPTLYYLLLKGTSFGI